MSRWVIYIVLWYFLPQMVVGQERCGVDYLQAINAAQDMNYQLRSNAIDRKISHYASGQSLKARDAVVIPVVVHVVYNHDMENITDEQIQSQIDVLNADFSALYIPKNIPEEFNDRYEDVGIRFCLASVNPQGQPTDGIVRKYTSWANIGLIEDASNRKRLMYDHLGGSTAWDTERYLNIWVCRLDQFLGYATKPGDALTPSEDGVVIDYRAFGNIGTALFNENHQLGRTGTHEIGHYLGLLHLWGKNVSGCGDDLVEDTPEQMTAHYGCPTYPQHSCQTSNMFMNFMDYTQDACMYMFTRGQGARMRATLELYRPHLLSGHVTQCAEFGKPQHPLKDRLKLEYNLIDQVIELSQASAQRELLHITVFDVTGRRVQSYDRISQKNITLSLDHKLAPGVYFLQVRTNDDVITFSFLTL